MPVVGALSVSHAPGIDRRAVLRREAVPLQPSPDRVVSGRVQHIDHRDDLRVVGGDSECPVQRDVPLLERLVIRCSCAAFEAAAEFVEVGFGGGQGGERHHLGLEDQRRRHDRGGGEGHPGTLRDGVALDERAAAHLTHHPSLPLEVRHDPAHLSACAAQRFGDLTLGG